MPNPPRIAAAAFSIPLVEVRDAWIELKCCGGTTYVPVKLVDADGAGMLGGVATRLRCDHSRQTPSSAALVGNAAQGSVCMTGGWSGYRVELIRDE